MNQSQRRKFEFNPAEQEEFYKRGATAGYGAGQGGYGAGYGAGTGGAALRGTTRQFGESVLLKKVQMQENRGRFLGLVFACHIFLFLLMSASTLLAMNSKKYRHFIHHQTTMIVLIVVFVILTLLLLFFEQYIKPIQPIYFILYAAVLALLTGFLATHLRSIIISYVVFMALFLLIGLGLFALTTSATFGELTSYLSVFGIAMIGLGIFSMLYHEDASKILYASIVVTLFGFFLVFWIQSVAAKYKQPYDDNDYFLGSLSMFTFVVNFVNPFG